MKKIRKTILIIFLSIHFVLPIISFGQKSEHRDSLNNKLITAAREIIAASGTCGLITLDEMNLPMVREMDPFPPENDFTVWFGTNPKTRKVNQTKKNPNVTLYYQDADASGYVVIHGIAQLVDDQKEKKKRWKVEWDAFYPDKADGYLLIKVSPTWMEIVSNSRGIIGNQLTWEPPIVNFK